jgi:Fe-S-cluster containining protein
LEECRAACCGHGVHVDLADASRIAQEADRITPHLPTDRRNVDAWFDGEVSEDEDFPSGHRVGTEVVPDPSHPAGTRCVFLRPDNRCALQATSMAEGHHPWDLKPFYCALYPLVLFEGTLQLDDDNEIYTLGGTCQRAERVPTPLYLVFKEELVLALGQDGYNQLCSIAQTRSGVKN